MQLKHSPWQKSSRSLVLDSWPRREARNARALLSQGCRKLAHDFRDNLFKNTTQWIIGYSITSYNLRCLRGAVGATGNPCTMLFSVGILYEASR